MQRQPPQQGKQLGMGQPQASTRHEAAAGAAGTAPTRGELPVSGSVWGVGALLANF